VDLSDLTTQFVGNGVANNFGLMNRRDLYANPALVTTFLNGSIMRIQRDLRVPAMEKWTTVTITSPYTGLVIPSDYLEIIGIYPQSSWVNRTRPDKLERAMNYAQFATDKPMIYSRQGGVWILGPAPAIGDTILLGYYAELTPLVNPTDTNILATVAWDLIVYGALVLACEYYNDKRKGATVDPNTGKVIDGFEGRYNQIFQTLQDMGADDVLDEGVMEPCYAYPDDDTDNFHIWVA
jgi:hypothetical protein